MAQKQQYLVISWQGLLQYISKNLVARGYYYWHLTELPSSKKNKWEVIDKKFIGKYKTNKNTRQRHYRKSKGQANFMYIRWQQYAFVFHTTGSVPDDVTYDDEFFDIRQTPLILKISDLTSFVIELAGNGKAHVKLSRETFLGFKAMLHNVAMRKNPKLLKDIFQMVNGFPSHAGVLRQKKALREYAVKQAIKHDIKIKSKDKKRNMQIKDFWIYSKSDTVKVFEDEK